MTRSGVMNRTRTCPYGASETPFPLSSVFPPSLNPRTRRKPKSIPLPPAEITAFWPRSQTVQNRRGASSTLSAPSTTTSPPLPPSSPTVPLNHSTTPPYLKLLSHVLIPHCSLIRLLLPLLLLLQLVLHLLLRPYSLPLLLPPTARLPLLLPFLPPSRPANRSTHQHRQALFPPTPLRHLLVRVRHEMVRLPRTAHV